MISYFARLVSALWPAVTDSFPSYNQPLYVPLTESDPEVQNIIDNETWRQYTTLGLTASENLTSLATLQASSSILNSRYSEGTPGDRFYGGMKHIDELEILCQKRALAAFDLDPNLWGVNVQPYSGSTANFAALTAILQPQDRLMGLKLSDGGHITHGHQISATRKLNFSSVYFESRPFTSHPDTGTVDYDNLASRAEEFKPHLIMCGASAYPRDWDYALIRAVANSVDAWVMGDIAHLGGFIAANELNDPFQYCDIVTATTHKSLRGPRGGLIFFRKNHPKALDLEKRINEAVSPICQNGPHNSTIAAIATSLKQVCQPEWKAYAKQVLCNAQVLAKALIGYGYTLLTDGTDTHLIIWDLRPQGLKGSKLQALGDIVGFNLNMTLVPGETAARSPSGVRLGTCLLTTRNMKESDIRTVAKFLHRAVELSLRLQEEAGSKLLKDFKRVATDPNGRNYGEVQKLSQEIQAFAMRWPLPGVDVRKLRKPANF
ncbi:hypothetical protein AGABI2DRAFT_116408 [Agaricus bisporus var. bisporus H97]|uniref:hypothetical protein n=1 Tax=Agaricus bisporus var. bisporus (strain H97 / ATCC MYA-4626 / FGSC 10389) TaxID=936046 RepID=UPI00029F69A1|nr:hypothetical protein AGABI2DRAFT_116408 [Agaricus bisporus var. bisporus H97]EKV49360.1 hypothetical protein AGABI2DRAFT_116408 [Agaricus bisporus var. bisporus H97]